MLSSSSTFLPPLHYRPFSLIHMLHGTSLPIYHLMFHCSNLFPPLPCLTTSPHRLIPLPSLHLLALLSPPSSSLPPHYSITAWDALFLGSPLADALLPKLIAFFFKTIHSQPSPKLNHILKLARTHVCHIQETQWSSLQYNHLLQQSPFCAIYHTPAIEASSSGVATLLPRSFPASSHSIIEPGFILSVTTEVCGLSCEFINIYLHPDQVVRLAQTLLRHLQTPLPVNIIFVLSAAILISYKPNPSFFLNPSLLSLIQPLHLSTPPTAKRMDTSARLTSFSSNSAPAANIYCDPCVH